MEFYNKINALHADNLLLVDDNVAYTQCQPASSNFDMRNSSSFLHFGAHMLELELEQATTKPQATDSDFCWPALPRCCCLSHIQKISIAKCARLRLRPSTHAYTGGAHDRTGEARGRYTHLRFNSPTIRHWQAVSASGPKAAIIFDNELQTETPSQPAQYCVYAACSERALSCSLSLFLYVFLSLSFRLSVSSFVFKSGKM